MKHPFKAATAATANEIVRTLPTSVQSTVNEMLKKGILFPSDLERLTGDPNTKYPPNKRKQGRPRKEVTSYPASFPESTGIKSYDDLFDAKTEKIIKAAGKRLFETGLFNSDFEDMEQELRMRLPSMILKFKAVPGKPEFRYRFISTAVYNKVNRMIETRRRENSHLSFVSLEENLDETGELTLENAIACDDPSSRDRAFAEMCEELEYWFSKLDMRDREIAFMRACLKMSYGEIAKRLGVVKNEVFYRMTVAIPTKIKAMKEA